VATGEIVWRDRTLSRSMLIGAGDRLILLDEDGTLVWPRRRHRADRARQSADSGKPAWTPPTLSGTTLYVATGATFLRWIWETPSTAADARNAPAEQHDPFTAAWRRSPRDAPATSFHAALRLSPAVLPR
jgi:hypothetical protein